MNALEAVQGGLVVSCQALESEPFHGPMLMAAMAWAAAEGGARGIRANGQEDIRLIKRLTGLPVIGIEKQQLPDGRVRITPTLEAALRTADAGADIIALETRASGPSSHAAEWIPTLKKRWTGFIMADVATTADATIAAEAGADVIATTLSFTGEGHTATPNWSILEQLIEQSPLPVIAEGGFWSPHEARRALDLGAFAVVVGSAITRPQLITRRFTAAMDLEQA